MKIIFKREKKRISAKNLGFSFGLFTALIVGWVNFPFIVGLNFPLNILIHFIAELGILIGIIFLIRWIDEGAYIIENKERIVRVATIAFVPFYFIFQWLAIGLFFISFSIIITIFFAIIITIIFTGLFYLISRRLIRETPLDNFTGTFIFFYPLSLRIFIVILLCFIVAGGILLSVQNFPEERLKGRNLEVYRINSAMQNIAAEAFFQLYPNYTSLSCEYEGLADGGLDGTPVCDYIERLAGNKPFIYAKEDEYCAYVQIDEDIYFCVDTKSSKNIFESVIETNIDPSVFCNGISYTCPK